MLYGGGITLNRLTPRLLFAAIWVEFREECFRHNADPESVLEEWLAEESMRETAAKLGHSRNPEEERQWAENDRLVLDLLRKMP